MKKPGKSAIPKADTGLKCPRCHCREVPVAYTRPAPRGLMRVRVCRYCKARIRTYERTD